MVERRGREEYSVLKPNSCCPPDREINILLLGQTGVGKTTFINAFANYITNDTLQQAEQDEMQIVIPTSFVHTSADTFDEAIITLGMESEHEKFADIGKSNTQQCRSFVFPIGNRNLRFIDTPGVGDTRGIEQDVKNFQEILNYIAQYEHLNGVCILLKPNEERMTILFRFCINELLRHLHVSARENLIFVFTNARSTFFMPGSSRRLLQTLLDKHAKEHHVNIPFNKTNSFLLDNEPFRYLALRKNGIRLDDDQAQGYSKSWNVSVKEYGRLMEHIMSCPLHAVSNTLSLNEAEQLVRKLARPIAETTKLIEQNIELANTYKKKVLENPEMASAGIPQNNPVVKPLEYPRTVCVGERCCRVTKNGDEVKMEYLHICHDDCFLRGVEQETLDDPKLEDCTAMDVDTGKTIKVFVSI